MRNDSVTSYESQKYGAATGERLTAKQTSFFNDYMSGTDLRPARVAGLMSNLSVVKAAAEIRETLTNASTQMKTKLNSRLADKSWKKTHSKISGGDSIESPTRPSALLGISSVSQHQSHPTKKG